MRVWVALLASSVAGYGLKAAGYFLPAGRLRQQPFVSIVAVMPVALLAALVAVQGFTTKQNLVLDARAAGLAAAAVLLLLRAPFLVVVAGAALVAAGLRAAGIG